MAVNLDRLSLPAFYLARDSSFPDAMVILKPSSTGDNGPFVSPDETSVMALPHGPLLVGLLSEIHNLNFGQLSECAIRWSC